MFNFLFFLSGVLFFVLVVLLSKTDCGFLGFSFEILVFYVAQ